MQMSNLLEQRLLKVIKPTILKLHSFLDIEKT